MACMVMQSCYVRDQPKLQGKAIFTPFPYSSVWLRVVQNIITRSSADADKPERRIERSVKVTKHSTIPYVRYFSSCAIITLSLKMRSFSDIRLQKCCDLQIWVRGHSRSLKVVPFYRLGVVSY